jgi:predicted  nucleic acid-binding Zn ribbon protein
MSNKDIYWKLRPAPPTPEDEICSCPGERAIVLAPGLSPNPIACADCNLEVPPERLELSEELSEDLADYNSFYGAFELLWLDSGEFEEWARSQLSDIASPVNTRGLALRKRLDASRRCYYWWFQDPTAEDYEPIARCPGCSKNLIQRGTRLVCEACGIMVAN